MNRIGATAGAFAPLVFVWLAAAWLAAPATAGPSRANIVRLPFPTYDGTLTPYTFDLAYPLLTLVYDTLMWRDARGVPRPWLARSLTRSRGGRHVTVTLRRGARWHDGVPVTATDVAFTFGYVRARFQPRFTPQVANVRRVRVTGRRTVLFELRRPTAGFDDQPLADVPILPRHLWQRLPAGRVAPRGLPVGSGPYRLVRAGSRNGYEFRANHRYFRGAPRVEQIRVPIIAEAARVYSALRQRRVDMVPLSLPSDVAQQFESMLGINVRRGPSYAGTQLVFNLRRAPFNRAIVRRAVAASLNLRRLVRTVAPAVPAVDGALHPASRWAPGTVLRRSDPAIARPTLSRLDIGPIRVLAPNNDSVRLRAGRQVVLALRLAGADATLVAASRARMSRATGEGSSRPDFDAAIQTIPALASQDPNFLTALFGADARSAPLNISGYHSRAFDRLARSVATARDRAARVSATRAELRLLARDLPSVPLMFSDGAFAYRPAIYDGWVFVKGTGILDKRSFLADSAAPDRASTTDDPIAEETGSRATFSLVDVLSLVVLGVVLALVGAALAQRRWRSS